jgi:hypothetical protein
LFCPPVDDGEPRSPGHHCPAAAAETNRLPPEVLPDDWNCD